MRDSQAIPTVKAALRAAEDFRRLHFAADETTVRIHRRIVFNFIRILDEKCGSNLKGTPEERLRVAEGLLEDAFGAVENLATRTGYFLGLSRGLRLAWPGGPLYLAKKGGAR
jgi:hypothetical protein